MIDAFKGSLRYLFRKKLRSGLIIAGIAIGVISVVLITSIGDMGKSAIASELDGLGLGGLTVGPAMQTGNTPLGGDDLEMIRRQEGVKDAVPILMEYTQIYFRGLVSNTVLWGIDRGSDQIISLQPLYGRLINASDVAAGANVCVVDRSVADAFYHRENIVGKKMRLLVGGSYQDFLVVGVVESGGNILQSMMVEYIPSFVYLPYTTLQRVSGKEYFDKIAIQAADDSQIDAVAERVVASLNAQNGFKNSYKAENMLRQKEKFQNILGIVTMVLSAIAGISLVVAGLGIMTIMMVSVSERTREIGIKKAVGAKNRVILAEFIVEAFTISSIGSIIGSVAGAAILYLATFFLGLPFMLRPATLLLCSLFTLLIGLIFGVYPAMQAARLRPVDALRYE